MAVLRLLAIPALVVALTFSAGCGSGSSSTSTSTGATGEATGASSGTTTSGAATPGSTTTTTGSGGSQGGQGGSGSSRKSGKESHSIEEEEAESGDQSIQEYGSEASGGEEEAIVATMRSFFRALAARDFTKVCAGLTSANREQLQQYAKLKHEGSATCASLLKTLLSPAGFGEARKAATATVSRVRVGEGNAFVLFRPAGGKVSYFVLKEEDGKWKSTSISAGSPLVP